MKTNAKQNRFLSLHARLILAALSFSLCLPGGASSAVPGDDGKANPKIQRESKKVLAGKWQLVSITQKGKTTPAVKSAILTLELLPDGGLQGSSGINRYDGAWKVGKGPAFDLSDFKITEKASLDKKLMSQEAKFTTVLLEVTQYAWEANDVLVLSDGDGVDSNQLRFTKVDK